MTCHDAKSPGFYHSLVDPAVAFVPLGYRQRINTCKKVLIPFIYSVSREVLDRCCNAFLFCRLDISSSHIDNPLNIISKSPDIHDRIVIVPVDINYWGKSPVNSNCSSFLAGNLAKPVGAVRIISSCNQHLSSVICTFYS